jgi:TolB-like protein/Tfp pilus assembly protein PilF
MMAEPEFLRELRRRHVFRVAIAYAVTAWLLLQLAAIVLPTFDAPHWLLRAVIGFFVLLFPVAILLAWAFEVTPEGVRRTEPADSEEVRPAPAGRRIGRRLDFTIIAILAIAVGVLAWRLSARPNPAAQPAVAQGAAASSSAGSTPTATSAIPAKSIAVLPFQNLSMDQANAYFAAGIQDEILTGLTKIGDLKVISRTSTQRYGSHPANLAEIAHRLGVANILEGSVQKVGDRVRVNVQLIDARSNNHIWAQTYDRKLDDVFAVESEVAQKIADSLQARLTQAERIALTTRPTDNPAAYEAYLKARTLLLGTAYDRALNDRILRSLQTAVALDPRFALAWAELASQEVWTYWSGLDSTPARLAAAKAALDRAMALAPKLPQVEMARGLYLYYGQRDFSAALAAMRHARRQLPGDARVWFDSALLERRLGQWDAAVTDFEHARVLSPNDVTTLIELATTVLVQRRFEQALSVIDTGLALRADDPSLLSLKLICVWNLNGLDGGERMLAAVKSDSAPVLALRGWQALYQRDYPWASALFRRAIAAGDDMQTPLSFGGYIPTRVEWQLQLALSEQRGGSQPAAAEVYHRVQVRATAALAANSGNHNVEAAWHAALGLAYAGLGQRDQAAVNGRRAVALISESFDTLEGPVWQDYLARIYAMNGDTVHALPLIGRLLQTTGSLITPALLKLDPVWDPIRHDPRFQALLKKYTDNDKSAAHE